MLLSRTARRNDCIETNSALEEELKKAEGARFTLIDGVFSIDGIIANLKGVCDLADKYGAMVMLDDSHTRRLRR
ncbi:aminotransferase class I/II-fold pyridoxal phosphate-dependent enzyme [Mesorhizobium sp. M1307]|uniref:aminotransferase class I/II-fold pyridoxal phosphate-dependent enzyme n=1 Tax=Mesorhizobium sp. M1307 TaxID=2957079 RepID=UPI00333B411B